MKHALLLAFAIGITIAAAQEKRSIDNDEYKTQTRSGDEPAISISGAYYKPEKNNLPYFLETKQDKQALYSPSLQHIKTAGLPPETGNKIKEAFGAYLKNDFQVEKRHGKSAGEYISYAVIIPYRITSNNTVEELVDYQINWQPAENNLSLRGKAPAAFKNTSVLASGEWFKIGITKGGIYKIDKAFLKKTGMDVSSLDPKNFRLYGNGGHMLPELNSAFRYDDLEENTISFKGNNDAVLDDDEYFLFYAQASDEWNFDKLHTSSCLTFNHQLNYYSDTSYYFLTASFGPGKRINNRASLSLTPDNTVTSYDYYDYHELNNTNFTKSGREFYGEYFDINSSYSFAFPVPNLVVGDTVRALADLAARSASTSGFEISYCGSNHTYTIGGVNLNDYLGKYVELARGCSSALCNSGSGLNFTITKLSPAALGWLDRLVFNCRRQLVFNNAQFNFRDSRSFRFNTVSKFVMNTANPNNLEIWDVSDPLNPVNQQYSATPGQVEFIANNFSLSEYCVFNGSDFYTPAFVSRIDNQDLHGIAQADYLIVTYPGFLSQAQRLAQLHHDQEGLSVSVVTTEQVYNEFSSGRPDISAIRDMARMLYTRDAAKPLKYLLLLGDGSYKVKERYTYGNTSMVPVYEVGYPLKTDSYCFTATTVTDDFYGWMDDFEGDDWTSGLVDVGVGRFPVKTSSEASAVVSKVESYYSRNLNFNINETESSCQTRQSYPLGDWRNWVCFIADDEDGQRHMQDADFLAAQVRAAHPEFNIDKIYADAFLQYATPGGERYPQVNSEIDHRFEKGALIINYTGHGGEVGLGHERFLGVSQIQSYKNKNKLPLMITATCEFSRFDDPDRTSAGELCLLNPEGAAIALLTTVRVSYSDLNLPLNSNVYSAVFDTLSNGRMPALGDITRIAKVKSGIRFNNLNFHLLGDPALLLAYPQQNVFTTSINNKAVGTVSDTLKSLSKVTVKGFVGDQNGNKHTNFNGILYPTVFDKKQKITCLGNDPSSVLSTGPFQFLLQKNIIYKGKVEVSKGDFSFTFIVPKDISYNLDKGKLSYYAHNGVIDARGCDTSFYIGGSVSAAASDNAGPAISLFLNDKKFVAGGITNEHPDLYAEVADSSGINTVGSGIGHDITAVLDQNSSKPVILNDYYEADLNSYQSGKIRYPFDQLSEGTHRLSLKVWDVQNNSSTAYTDFVVAKSAELALSHVLNYPNPFTTRTEFFFENNRCCQSLKVSIQVFTISGKIVKTDRKSVV